MSRKLILSFIALVLGACAAPMDEPLGTRSAAIVDGEFETGRPEVVFLYRLDGAACTGAIIAPRVVLTADHCVAARGGGPAPASYFRVYVGSSIRRVTREYSVSAVRPVPNAGLGQRQANDLALLILSEAASETPLEIARTTPSRLWGQTVTSVGYGQTPSGGSGTKFTTTTTVQGIQEGFIFVDPSVCSGDSGGPLIGSDGLVYGVASFIYSADGRTQPTCGTAPGAYNEIYRHLDHIDAVLEESGLCVPDPEGVEICDGTDNNCDGEIDEGCIQLGDPCSDDSECVGGLCADTSMGRICTQPCDPLRPEQGCGASFYCSATVGSCDGYCVRGEAGGAAYGDLCNLDTDCATLFCADAGNGERRCYEPCRGDSDGCYAGEVCTSASSCGACVAESIFFGGHGLGESCGTDTDCREGLLCAERGGVRACVSSCENGETCAERFACLQGVRTDEAMTQGAFCFRDRTQGVGGVCLDNADCGEAVCASQGVRSWCTAACTGAADCPSGFDCVDAGGAMVCAPMANLLGESCTSSAECVSGQCTGDGVCTDFCDTDDACATGFLCTRYGDGTGGVCLPAPEFGETSGGCQVRPVGNPSNALSVLGFLAFAFWMYRRRSRV